jgi:hypothetical protein
VLIGTNPSLSDEDVAYATRTVALALAAGATPATTSDDGAAAMVDVAAAGNLFDTVPAEVGARLLACPQIHEVEHEGRHQVSVVPPVPMLHSVAEADPDSPHTASLAVDAAGVEFAEALVAAAVAAAGTSDHRAAEFALMSGARLVAHHRPGRLEVLLPVGDDVWADTAAARVVGDTGWLADVAGHYLECAGDVAAEVLAAVVDNPAADADLLVACWDAGLAERAAHGTKDSPWRHAALRCASADVVPDRVRLEWLDRSGTAAPMDDGFQALVAAVEAAPTPERVTAMCRASRKWRKRKVYALLPLPDAEAERALERAAEARKGLAANRHGLPDHVWAALAADPDPKVRQTLADNPTAPEHVKAVAAMAG